MNKNKVWIIGAILVIVAIVGGGWMIGIAPQLATIANANQNRANVQIQNATNQALLARLKKDYQNIDGLKKELDSLRVAVPASAEISTFVTELNTLANSHQITVKSISVNDAKSYTPIAPAPASTSDKAPGETAVNTKITAANFVVIPVQFSVTGNYAKVLNFVHDVQVGPRLFLVSTLTSTGSTEVMGAVSTGKINSTIGGFIYVLLQTPEVSKP
ncbi:MAG: hypothetical protein AABY37_01815 [Actinomycetota bacterium]